MGVLSQLKRLAPCRLGTLSSARAQVSSTPLSTLDQKSRMGQGQRWPESRLIHLKQQPGKERYGTITPLKGGLPPCSRGRISGWLGTSQQSALGSPPEGKMTLPQLGQGNKHSSCQLQCPRPCFLSLPSFSSNDEIFQRPHLTLPTKFFWT